MSVWIRISPQIIHRERKTLLILNSVLGCSSLAGVAVPGARVLVLVLFWPPLAWQLRRMFPPSFLVVSRPEAHGLERRVVAVVGLFHLEPRDSTITIQTKSRWRIRWPRCPNLLRFLDPRPLETISHPLFLTMALPLREWIKSRKLFSLPHKL